MARGGLGSASRCDADRGALAILIQICDATESDASSPCSNTKSKNAVEPDYYGPKHLGAVNYTLFILFAVIIALMLWYLGMIYVTLKKRAAAHKVWVQEYDARTEKIAIEREKRKQLQKRKSDQDLFGSPLS